jgi:CRP-like cAMP-binding protein
MTIERVSVLHRAPLFAEVPGRALVAVARLLEEVHVDAGATVIERGAWEDWLFVVAAGSVRVHVGDRTLAVLGAGGVVGELAVLAPAPRAASATAVEATLLLRLRRAPFEELLEDRPEIARAVIHTLARLLQAADHRVDVTEA